MYRVAVAILLLIFAGLQYRLWIGPGSFADVHRIRTTGTALEKVNEKDEARNDTLQAEINDLKTGNAAAEGKARSEMGMIKKNETFFLTLPENNDKSSDSKGPGGGASSADNSASSDN